jgi:hypothetical protein
MIKKFVRLAVATSLVAFATAASANAQTALNNRTVLTFSQPVEVPGKILPAGTYTFEMHDSGMNRHVIEIFDEGGTKLQALVLAIPSYRAKATEDTVIKFAEVAPGQPQAIRFWYSPGQTTGNALVYSKTRARELAAAANLAVTATDDTLYVDSKMDTMKSAEVVTMTPQKTEVPVQYQAPPPEPVVTKTEPVVTPTPAPVAVTPTPEPTPAPVPERRELPRTASTLSLVVFVGMGLLALGIALRGLNHSKVSR